MHEPVPLKPTTVRFTDDSIDLVRQAADLASVSLSQFVREAAIMRAALLVQDRHDLAKLSRLVQRLARNSDDP